ncbi:MAG: choice-of-anchor Q domain-containing protein [Chitinophagales bacterium]
MNTNQSVILSALLLLSFLGYYPSAQAQTTYHINANTPCTTGCNGTSWATAFDHLQDALDVAATYDEIWVAEGTYYPTKDKNGNSNISNNRDKTFNINQDLEIYGGFPNSGNPTMNDRNPDAHPTILDGDLNGDDAPNLSETDLVNDLTRQDNAYTVVFSYNRTAACILSGFDIRNGNANVSPSNGEISSGGGMYITNGSPSISQSKFYNNSANNEGGGMYNRSGSPNISQSTFYNNSANNEGGGMYNNLGYPSISQSTFYNNSAGQGGGMYNYIGSATISQSTFHNNTAVQGGGMYNDSINPNISQCAFYNNAANQGGGMYNYSGNHNISQSTFYNNSAGQGGGIFNFFGSYNISQCTLYNNSANSQGGGMFNYYASPVLTNCSFSKNAAGVSGVVYNFQNSNPLFTNCILWDNGGGAGIVDDQATTTVHSSIVEGGWTGAGANNLNQDPLFIDADNGNLRILSTSPAIDAGDNTADLDGNGSGTQTIADVPFDLAGNTRIVDFDKDNTATVDMGAYEKFIYHVNANTPCTTGCNGTSWATAFDHLQDALDVAVDNDIIWVAEGTYYPTKDEDGNANPSNNRYKTFHINQDLEIYGGFPNSGNPTMNDRNPDAHPTILDGDLNGDDAPNLSGTDLVNDLTRQDNAYTVVFSSNRTAACILSGFDIRNGNATISFNSEDGSSGGGMYNTNGNPRISQSKFYNNSANYRGGGMSIFIGSPNISQSTFYNNSATFAGGMSIYIGSPNISQSTFYNNSAGTGGGMYNDNSNPNISQSKFYNNSANVAGGIYNAYSTPVLTNCSFSKNAAGGGTGVVYNFQSNSLFTNCILWDNGGGAGIVDDQATTTVHSSIVEGGWTGAGANNLNQDPLFIDADNGDLRISACSPAIDAGDNTADLDGSKSGTQTIADLPFDLTGNARIVNAIVDMGAYEASGNLILESNSPLCVGEDLQLTPVASSQLNYQWSGPDNFNSMDAAPVLTNVSASMSGNYFVTVSDGNGCSSIGQVSANILPTVSFTTTADICLNAGVQTLSGGIPTGGTYSGSGLGVLDKGDGETFDFNPTAAGIGKHTVTYTYSDTNGCIGSATATIEVYTPIASASTTPICNNGSPANLTVTTNASNPSYVWSSGTSGNNSANVTVSNPVNNAKYTVTITDGNHCSQTAEVTLTVNPLSTPNITGSLIYCASDNTTTLDAGILVQLQMVKWRNLTSH